MLSVYRMNGFPQNECHGLISHLGRATLPLPTNIAEGSKRNIAEASLAQTGYLLMVSRDLGCTTQIVASKVFDEISELSRMLRGLAKKVEAAK